MKGNKMPDKIMDCEKCPYSLTFPCGSDSYCSISSEPVDTGIPESNCPILRIEFRDGTVFEPKGKESDRRTT
jgi:hypothetical protein